MAHTATLRNAINNQTSVAHRSVFVVVLNADLGCLDRPQRRSVIDGDTIRVYHKQPNVRLVGFNGQAEGELGAKATRRVRDLVQAGNLDFEFVPCSCPPGTEGTPSCNYGRRCGTLKANRRDVGAILIEEGLAVPFQCGATRCPKMPRAWCEAQ